ncbi:porin [Szabonella alba]|uniref:Porin n=1 Tax=Szabonella alba TaxID=2804194 RepID=A0A8K0Y0E5_9RHOB|nr:porin [Szabonella alba]MBL4918105.1 porin [Szabonella alba]
MKKLLIATTALVATAGVAAADVKLSGYGRFGLDYRADRGLPNGPGGAVTDSKTQVNMRMRLNIDASTETDSGVTFGGRFRLQSSTNSNATATSAALLYATYAGMRMEVGNTNNAFDTAKLVYNSEMGYLDRSFGDPITVGAAYSSSTGVANTMGIFASYNFGAGSVRVSWKTPDQTTNASVDEEVQISADYAFGQFTVSGVYSDNTGGLARKDYFIGAEYAVNSDINVGLLHFRGKPDGGASQNRTTLYGNYSMGAITYRGYVAHDNSMTLPFQTKTAFGLGLDYDLGGARLGADIHRSYDKETVAGLGVRFDF